MPWDILERENPTTGTWSEDHAPFLHFDKAFLRAGDKYYLETYDYTHKEYLLEEVPKHFYMYYKVTGKLPYEP